MPPLRQPALPAPRPSDQAAPPPAATALAVIVALSALLAVLASHTVAPADPRVGVLGLLLAVAVALAVTGAALLIDAARRGLSAPR